MNHFRTRYGEWAVITGASDGIGLAMAEWCAKKGINLVLVARRENVLNDVATELSKKHSIKTQVVSSDLGLLEGFEKVVAATSGLNVGLFIAAAGFGTSGQFLKSDITVEANMVDVNCRSVVVLTHHFAKVFSQNKRGGIVLMSSVVGFQGVPKSANYAATKAYIQSLAEALYVEFKPYNVDVIASAPGPVNSGFATRADMKMKMFQTPAEVAAGTLNALGRKSVVRPGFLAKFLGYLLSTAPRSIRVKIMASIMSDMTIHKN